MAYGEQTSQRELSDAKAYGRSRTAMKRAEERRVTPTTYAIAHGSAAVQAARIIAAAPQERRRRAEAYQLAAEWHEARAKPCEEMAKDAPRLSAEIRSRAAAAATHHRASAAGLRLAAADLLRVVAVETAQ